MNKLTNQIAILGLAVAGLVIAFVVNAAGPWYVSAATGNDANDCLSPATACKTIQAAINKASPGDTINVAAGVYAEHITLNKSVALNGANSAVACRGPRGTESVITGSSTGAVAITADNVTLNGFQVSSPLNDLGSGIWTSAGGTVKGFDIKNNLISQNQIGLFANSNGASWVRCDIFDGNNEPGSTGGTGLYSEVTDSLTIDNNEFKNHLINHPINFAAVGVSVHDNLTVSNNIFRGSNGYGIRLMGVDIGSFTGNDIETDDATGLVLDSGNSHLTVTGNTFHDGWHAVRVRDDAGLPASSDIHVNRNSILNHSDYGIGNESGYAGDLDAECNWWGSTSGPGPVGTGSGDGVTTLVDFTPWLTTSDLAHGPCNGPLPNVTVTNIKYIGGAHATTGNANSQSFPMQSAWSAQNIGAGSGTYSLSSPTYQAQTSSMSSGANYATNEDTSGQVVGATCADGKPFALVGYTSGDSEAQAASQTPTTTSPSLTNITTDKFIIVWNQDCTPKLTVIKLVINDNGGAATTSDFTLFIDNATTTSGAVKAVSAGPHVVSETNQPGYTASLGGACDANGNVTLAPNENKICTLTNNDNPPPPPPANACSSQTPPPGYTLVNGTPKNDKVTLTPFSMFVGNGGNDNVKAGDGDYVICTGSGNDSVAIGSGNSTIDAGNGNNIIKTGDGTGTINTGSGNDVITTGNGPRTINAGSGSNVIKTGSGNQLVTTGSGNDNITTNSGNDTINAGNGHNTVKSGGGNDNITAGSGNDNIDGGPGAADTCNAGGGSNTVTNCEL